MGTVTATTPVADLSGAGPDEIDPEGLLETTTDVGGVDPLAVREIHHSPVVVDAA